MNFAVVSASAAADALAMGHRVRASVATRIYLFPFLVSGSGPTKSSAIRSKTCPTCKEIKSFLTLSLLYLWQASHARTYVSTSTYIHGHQYAAWTISSVVLIPKC